MWGALSARQRSPLLTIWVTTVGSSVSTCLRTCCASPDHRRVAHAVVCGSPLATPVRSPSLTIPSTSCDQSGRCSGSPTQPLRSPRWHASYVLVAECHSSTPTGRRSRALRSRSIRGEGSAGSPSGSVLDESHDVRRRGRSSDAPRPLNGLGSLPGERGAPTGLSVGQIALPCVVCAIACVRWGPQNCSPFWGALLHGLPCLVVALHLAGFAWLRRRAVAG